MNVARRRRGGSQSTALWVMDSFCEPSVFISAANRWSPRLQDEGGVKTSLLSLEGFSPSPTATLPEGLIHRNEND